MGDYRLNISEFAAASQIASQIYRDLCPRQIRGSGSKRKPTNPDTPGPIFRPYPHNHLTARIKSAAAHQQKASARAVNGNWFATEITVADIAHALQGLDLGRDASPNATSGTATAAVKIFPLGPKHNPTHLRITGLHEAALAIRTQAGTHVECRIHLVQSRISERRHDPSTNKWTETPNLDEQGHPVPRPKKLSPSDWIPTEIIPGEGIKLPIPENHADSQHISAVLIEWREHRTQGRRIVRLHEHGIVRIAAVHAPAKAWPQHQQEKAHPSVHHLFPATSTLQAPKKPDWRKAPKDYLHQALTRIRPRQPVPG